MKNFLTWVFFFYSMVVFGQDQATTSKLRGYLTENRKSFDVTHYNLKVYIDIDNKSISGLHSISFTSKISKPTLELDLYPQLVVDSIFQHKTKINWKRKGAKLWVNCVSKTHPIRVFYHGKPIEATNPPWDGGFVWKTDSLGLPWVGVACEGKGASLWWPCKDHPSDEPDSVTTTFLIHKKYADLGLKVVGNGTKISQNNENEWVATTWKVTYPINLYNITFYLGKYQASDYVHKGMALRFYFLDSSFVQKSQFVWQAKTMLDVFEKSWGPYPFRKDGYQIIEAPYWGMEHQSAIAYGNHGKKNAFGFDFILVHESAHEWWGNSISCGDHGELWIHETFATYSEALYVEHTLGKSKMIQYLKIQRDKIENKSPMLGPLNINYNQWADNDIYYKGTWMMFTLRNMVHNDRLWFSFLQKLYKKFSFKVIHTEELLKFMEKELALPVGALFRFYLTHLEWPALQIRNTPSGYDLRWAPRSLEATLPVYFPLTDGSDTKVVLSTQWTSYPNRNLDFKKFEDFYLIKVSEVPY